MVIIMFIYNYLHKLMINLCPYIELIRQLSMRTLNFYIMFIYNNLYSY
jgi:hypothetical protein